MAREHNVKYSLGAGNIIVFRSIDGYSALKVYTDKEGNLNQEPLSGRDWYKNSCTILAGTRLTGNAGKSKDPFVYGADRYTVQSALKPEQVCLVQHGDRGGIKWEQLSSVVDARINNTGNEIEGSPYDVEPDFSM